MRVAVLDHNGKSAYLSQQLAENGFELAQYADVFDYELMLVDSEHPLAPPAPVKHNTIKEAVGRGIPIVLYPHGGSPNLEYDGMRRFSVPISMHLLHGEGDAEIYRRCGLTHRYEVVGWTYGPQIPPRDGPVDHLVFAPIHPLVDRHGNWTILPPYRALNQQAYRHFLDHPAPRKTVRLYGSDDVNGVHERVDGVDYQDSDWGIGTDLIDDCDAVVSYGTFGYNALARGKKMAMIYGYPGHVDDNGQAEAAHLDLYADYMRYPAPVGDAPLTELLDRDVTEWKRLFVGEPLDIDKVCSLLRSLRPNRAKRRALARR